MRYCACGKPATMVTNERAFCAACERREATGMARYIVPIEMTTELFWALPGKPGARGQRWTRLVTDYGVGRLAERTKLPEGKSDADE